MCTRDGRVAVLQAVHLTVRPPRLLVTAALVPQIFIRKVSQGGLWMHAWQLTSLGRLLPLPLWPSQELLCRPMILGKLALQARSKRDRKPKCPLVLVSLRLVLPPCPTGALCHMRNRRCSK